MPDGYYDDDVIIRRVLAGEPEVFAQLIDKYGQAIHNQMRNYAGDLSTAEELAHEVFVEAYLNLAKYRGEGPFGNWLSRIATITGYKHWQARGKRKREVEFSEERDCAPAKPEDAGERTDPEEARKLVYEMLAVLPTNDRLVLTLTYLEDCSHEEIALRLGWRKSLIAMRLFNAKRKLRKLAARQPWKERVQCIIS